MSEVLKVVRLTNLNFKSWCYLLVLSTLLLAFAFSVFQYESHIALSREVYSGNPFAGTSVKFRVRVVVESARGYLEGNPSIPASGVAVTLNDRVLTSPSGEAVFFVPPGIHEISVEDPLGLMVPWNDSISVQGSTTVKVMFDFEATKFEKISVSVDLIRDASAIELEYKIPTAKTAYVGGPFITCWSSGGRLQLMYVEPPSESPSGLPSYVLRRQVQPGTSDTYVMNVSGIAVLYVFPESSYMPMWLVFATVEGE